MRIYWSLDSVPELAYMSKSERTLAWWTCCKKAFRHWQTWLALAVLGLSGPAGERIGTLIFGDLSWMALLCAFLCTAIGTILFRHVIIQVAVPYLREELLHPNSIAV